MNEMNKLDYFIYLYDINNEKVGFSEIKFLSIGIQDTELLKPVLSNNIQTYSKELNLISNNDFNSSNRKSGYFSVDYSSYDFKVINNTNDFILLNMPILLEAGSRYTILFFKTNATLYDYALLTDIHPCGLHISLQLLQILLMAIAEILVSISGLTFSYEEAPASMKSLMQALWILTTSVGNLLVFAIAESNFSNQVLEYIIYIILLSIATFIFFICAYFYKYVDNSSKININDNPDNKEDESLVVTGDDLEKDLTLIT